jgi:hypothetical protein
MASVDAAVFEVSNFPIVGVEALMVVHELIETLQPKELANNRHKKSTLSGRESASRKGKQDETTSTLDDERRGVQPNSVREERLPRVNRNHGRSDSHRCSEERGGKR